MNINENWKLIFIKKTYGNIKQKIRRKLREK